jgi:hypothetical protein
VVAAVVADPHVGDADAGAADAGAADAGKESGAADAGKGAGAADAGKGAGAADAGEDAGEDAGAADRDEDTLSGAYGARRIRIKDLRTSALKRLIWVAIVQIAIVAVLMAVQKVHQPQVNSGVPGAAGGTFVVPVAVFAGAVAIFGFIIILSSITSVIRSASAPCSRSPGLPLPTPGSGPARQCRADPGNGVKEKPLKTADSATLLLLTIPRPIYSVLENAASATVPSLAPAAVLGLAAAVSCSGP